MFAIIQAAGWPIWPLLLASIISVALIIERLEKSRLLLKATNVAHSYPHCWRCKNPILFRAAKQWFLKVTDAFRTALVQSTNRGDAR